MAIAEITRFGLENWSAEPAHLRKLPSAPRELVWLGQTPLWAEHERWRGRPVFDSRGRHLGKVRDILVETRTLDEAAWEDDPKGWGVRTAYFALRCRQPRRPWLRPREVLLPARKVWEADGSLRADVDASQLWPRLFGRTI